MWEIVRIFYVGNCGNFLCGKLLEFLKRETIGITYVENYGNFLCAKLLEFLMREIIRIPYVENYGNSLCGKLRILYVGNEGLKLVKRILR